MLRMRDGQIGSVASRYSAIGSPVKVKVYGEDAEPVPGRRRQLGLAIRARAVHACDTLTEEECMAEDRNDREKESLGDEMEDRNRTSRQGQGAEPDRDRKSSGEPTDTLEDRNLSGSST